MTTVSLVPFVEVRPGVPLDHLDWGAQAIMYYRPDVVIRDDVELPRFRGQAVVLVPNSRLLDVHRSYQQRGLPPQTAEALHFS